MKRKLIFGGFLLLLAVVAIFVFPVSLDKADKPQPLPEVEVGQTNDSNIVEEKLDLSSLEQILKKEILSYKGEVAVAATDLKTGRSVAVDSDKVFYPASVIKVLLLVSVLDDVENGKYSLESVDRLIVDVMKWSSNEAANQLIQKTGFEKLNGLPEKIGLKHTVFIHGFGDREEDVIRLRPGANSFTANDANLLWRKLFSGEILSPTMTKKALDYSKLPNVKLIYSLQGVSVYHKPGDIPYAGEETYIDCGVVESKNFSYVVSYFSRNNPTHQAGADFGLKLTKIIYEWFGQQYSH